MVLRTRSLLNLLVAAGVCAALAYGVLHRPAHTSVLAPARPGLLAIPLPRLESHEPAVVQQILEFHQAFADLVSKTDLTDTALAESYGLLGQVYYVYGFLDSAEACYSNARRLVPADYRWPHLLGYLYQQSGRLEESVGPYTAALGARSDDFAAMIYLGEVLMRLNRPAQARAQFRAALAAYPAAAFNGLGEIALAEGGFEEAARHFEAALQRVPRASRIHYSLAMAYRGLGRLDQVEAQLQQLGQAGIQVSDPVLDHLPSLLRGERVNLIQGQVAYQAGQFTAAADAFGKAVDAAPASVRAHVNLALSLAALGDTEPAIQQLQAALRLDDGDVTAHLTIATLAGIDWRYPLQYQSVAEWTSPVTDRFLLQASVLLRGQRYPHGPISGLNPLMINVLEQSTGLQYRARAVYDDSWTQNFFYRITMSHVTGAHQTKVGFNDGNGVIDALNYNNQPVSYRFNNGVPNQITMRAYPFRSRTPQDHNLGVYGQDRWTIDRLTVNLGVRYDYYSNSFPEQHLGPGPFTPDRDITFPAQENAAWHDLTPKSGAAYDLFGNGKTALKVSLNKYLEGLGIGGLTADPNPVNTIVSQTTRSWTDANNDFIPDCNLLNTALNRECGAMADPNFGTARPGTAFDVDRMRGWGRRGFNWEFSAGVQQQLLPRVSVDASYFRRWYGNFTATDNLTVEATDFSPFSITAPTDSRLPEGGGYEIAGLKDLNPSKFGQPARNFVTRASTYGTQIDHWNGVDFSVNARPRTGLLFQGGFSTGYATRDNCEILAKLPEMAPLNYPYCHVHEAFLTQVKALGSYALPRVDVLISATLQSLPGAKIAANYTATNAVVAPSLGRNLSGNAANVTVNLVAPGTMYIDRFNEVDIRAAKIFRLGRTSTSLNFDLYNVFNSDAVLGVNNSYGAWLRPT